MKRSYNSEKVDDDPCVKRKYHNHHQQQHLFRCRNNKDFDVQFPHFAKPQQNGYFSTDSTGKFHHNKSQLRYYFRTGSRDINFDLKIGFRELIKKDNSQCYLNDLHRWIMHNSEKFTSENPQYSTENKRQPTKKIKRLPTDFICWRGLLTKLLCTPYERNDDWIIAVSLFKGTYYLCEFETERKKLQMQSMTERDEEMCYGGFKFEQYVTSDEPNGTPNTNRPVNNNEAFCLIVRSRLNKHSLLFGGEVDATDEKTGQYIEMKTTREITSEKQNNNFLRFKSIKWWAQSFLIGISKIVCGYRTDNGVVHTVKEIDVHHIPKMAQAIENPWKANICFNFLDQFLQFIKDQVTEDDPRIVYLCRWSPRNDVTCTKLEPNSEFVFLPEWYTQWEAWE